MRALDTLFWIDGTAVITSPPPYNTNSTVYSGAAPLDGIAVDSTGNAVLILSTSHRFIGRLNGGGFDAIWNSPTIGPTVMALDTSTGFVYWATAGIHNVVYRTNYTDMPASPEEIAGVMGTSYGMACDTHRGKLYYSEYETGKIYRVDMNTRASELYYDNGGANPILTLYINATDLFWATSAPMNNLAYAPLDAPVPVSADQVHMLGLNAAYNGLAMAHPVSGRLSFFATDVGADGYVKLLTQSAEGYFNAQPLFQTVRPGGILKYVAFDASDDCSGDADGDGVTDCADGCPNDAGKSAAGQCGCGVPDTDSDSDGMPDCLDACPSDANKTAAGACGCGTPDTDRDGDGTPDCLDGCPNDALKTDAGLCGCGLAETGDSDGDGTPDCLDGCPSDTAKTSAGACGCGVPETATCGGQASQPDSDSDGTPDLNDGCPQDADKTAPGRCGCGRSEKDSDGNGVPDCLDLTGEPAPVLTPHTVPLPAEVAVQGKNAAVYMERFSGAALETALKQAGKRKKLSFSYEVVLTPAAGRSAVAIQSAKARVIRQIARKNKVVYRNLKRGTYSVSYRLRITQGTRVVAKTAWSAQRQFSVGG